MYSFEGNLNALGGSLYLCTTRRSLFYVSHSELGPYGVSSDHPIYYVSVLADLVYTPANVPANVP